MTMPSTVIKSGPYVGNGVATSFAYGFKIFASADLRVVHTDSAGLETDLVLGVDYSVTGVGDPTGSITYPLTGSPLASPETLTLISAIDIDQTTNLSNQGGFFPEVHETVFDRLCRMIQQLSEQLSRAVKTDVSSTITPDDLLASIETSESNAADSAAAALISENNAASSYDSFDDRYLGAKASAPSVDNDGNALIVGAKYWNSVTNNEWSWTGSAWVLTTATAASSAAAVAVADLGGYYAGADVEAALQEVGVEFAALPSKAETLTNKTLTSPVLNGSATGTAIARGCLVYKSASESITSGVYSHITFDTEIYDSDAIHDGSTNTHRLTVPSGVTKVKVVCNVMWQSGGAGQRIVRISLNDDVTTPPSTAGLPNRQDVLTTTTSIVQNISSAIVDVTAGDFLTVAVFQNSGGAVNIFGGKDSWVSLEIIK